MVVQVVEGPAWPVVLLVVLLAVKALLRGVVLWPVPLAAWPQVFAAWLGVLVVAWVVVRVVEV